MAQKPERLGVDDRAPRRRSPSPAARKRKNKAASRSPAPEKQTEELVRSSTPPLPLKKNKNKEAYVVKNNDVFLLPGSDYNLMILLTVLAVGVRLFRIYQPSSVVFDEVHFGGFAMKYIKGKFFMDVHPPLAKLLITLAGWMAGFDGSFDFKEIGKDYLEPGVPYVAMRLLPAICGIAVVPTIFLTLKAAGCSTAAATLGSGLVIFENALVTQSRLILLDSPLIIFTAVTALAWTSFLNAHQQGHSEAFSANWWFWLTMSGLGLGATASVKWVGLFTIAWVGSLTVLQLWFLLGDTKNVSASKWMKHLVARAICLIGVPIAFYMSMFAIHFLILTNPGDGDGFMSSEFQSTLRSKGMQDVPANIAYGSRVSIRHHNTQGGYLHSHASMYPTGSKQQQITLYPHKDTNNDWYLENMTYPEGGVGISGFDESEPIWIEDGAVLKLYHVSTDRRLHSHDVRAPVTEAEWQNEVSAYGYKGFEGDANDHFRVEIVKSMSDGAEAKKRLRTIQTKFRLVHTMTGCTLFSHKVKLPSWGFEQQEVTCAKGGTLPNSIWYIESNHHPQLKPDAERVNYRRPGFFGKFWELQKVMWKTNAGLVESHAWDSRPESWPILRRGINFWGKDHRQIYLIGNPIIWWTSSAAVVIYMIFKGLAVLRWQRGYSDYQVENFRRFDYEVGTAVLGWAFHYFPFFLMQRQLFLHHYLPALYFAIIALCQVFDFFAFRIRAIGLRNIPAIGWIIAMGFLSVSALVFGLYSPLTYGSAWTKNQCRAVKLFDKWDWDCNTFLDNLDAYSNLAASPTQSTATQAHVPSVKIPEMEQKAPESQEDAPALSSDAPDQLVTSRAGSEVVQEEEHVEYRDQDGNILDPEQVAELQGKVEFETKYETRYRVVDEEGNEVDESEQEEAPQIYEAEGEELRAVPEDEEETVPRGEDPEETHTVWVEEDAVEEEAVVTDDAEAVVEPVAEPPSDVSAETETESESAPEEVASEEAVSEEAAPEEIVAEAVPVPEEVVVEAVSEEAVPAPEEAAPEAAPEAVPEADEAVVEKVVKEDAAPVESAAEL
ncbi:Dolichyl-phosphate-mannose-protein mannosyltransferase-domain-containing protein [Geopyxis carbonaria]|nr:Dolichyl-phosphate-mannose-protein mannosyltransferase-domain-containing protein [Geopyxis carbonaria]